MKKKVASKVLAGVLASVMVFGLAACGNDGETGGSSNPASSTPQGGSSQQQQPTPVPTAEPPIKLTISMPSDKQHMGADDGGGEYYEKLVKEINEYCNAEITWQWADMNTYYDQLSSKITTNDLADIIIGPTNGPGESDVTVLTAARQGQFWDLAPYYKDYDNLAAIPDITMEALSDNGKLYYLPRTRDLGRWGWAYRKDWAEKLGVEPKGEVCTWDEFKRMLEAFSTMDPDGNSVDDTYGLILDQWGDVFRIIGGWFNVPNNWGLDANGNLVHFSQMPEYKTMLKEVRELYQNGYINDGKKVASGVPAFYDVNAGGAKGYLQDEKGGVYIQCVDDIRKWELSGAGLRSKGYGTVEEPAVRIEGAIDIDGDGVFTAAPNGFGFNGTVMFSTKNVKDEATLRRVLDVYNKLQDGAMHDLMDYGWKDLTYIIDKDGYAVLLDQETGPEDNPRPTLSDTGVGSANYRWGFNQIWTLITAEENAATLVGAPPTEEIQKREQYLRYTWTKDYCVVDYGAGLSSETLKDAETGKVLNDILWTHTVGEGDGATTVQGAGIRFIIGEIDENGLDAELKRWLDAGGKKATEEMNALYKAGGQ